MRSGNLCPIKFLNAVNSENIECEGEACEWWCENAGCCSVQAIVNKKVLEIKCNAQTKWSEFDGY